MTAAGTDAPLVIEGLTVTHASAAAPVIADLSLSVRAGEIRGLVGESGSGKSVTCLAAMGLLDQHWSQSGRIHLAGSETPGQIAARRGTDAAMVFQDATASLNPIQRIGHQLTDSIARLRKLSKAEAKRVALDLLRRVDMPDPETRYAAYPFQLSGGQNQRVMIALALAGNPGLLFADEPTTALDVTVQAQILGLLKSIRDETGMGMIFVTHDLGVVEEICDTVSVMYAGRIVESGPVSDVIRRPRHPYTDGLIASMPKLRGDLPQGIAGQVPPPGQRPAGCAFASRCDRAAPDCMAVLPPLEWADDRAVACLHPLDAKTRPGRPTIGAAAGPSAATAGDVPLIALNAASCDYRVAGGTFRAVSNVSLSVAERESVAIIGESGSGKSTIGKLMLGIEAPSEGEVLFRSGPVPMLGSAAHRAYARDVQLVPQNPYLSLDPRATIGDQVCEPMAIHSIGTPAERLSRRDALLTEVGLGPEFASRYPHQISGGQCQRAVIARALCLEPRLLICDEATASLDVSVQARIVALLRDLQARFELSLVFITHDLRIVGTLCQQVAVMKEGALVEVGAPAKVLTEPGHPYTRALLDAVPEREMEVA